ncbi:hypothetical protein V9T40_012336 [Parthenolecanium corni]|uniref:Uncharacterized protein n=1 Tax=Parthenolecanium corni TaxID=536013 RepID=A0AAN9T7M2_9HEMI
MFNCIGQPKAWSKSTLDLRDCGPAFTCGPPKGWREDGGVKVKVAFASAVVVIVVEILENATVPLIWPTFFSSLEGVRAALVIVFHT